MILKEYLRTKSFLRQLGLSVLIVAVCGFLFLTWLRIATDHGDEITVPELKGMREYEFKRKLLEMDLNFKLLDSADYNEQFPKYSVVEQNPAPGSKVKKGRKVYLKLNSSGFSLVSVPDLLHKTYREATPSIVSRGLRLGTITYAPHVGKDVVLGMSCRGRILTFGDKVYKSSKIDLILGDGSSNYTYHRDSISGEYEVEY